ncbi:phosphoribosylformylglycinamidine synthase [Dyadobacter flavalbus]|uniref:Phosphoribosylformylglycinamidine synthase n=1 Tax=Dyadobacter flavalbus TaxID=2579942 RepID=A0A5M8QVN1_9BACT|nr:HAEPLYID family protein [Dyadobacter flavalbus]KAA6439381.1 phosphoribosylformylglycinamidine synthase [Dyadobacter flavalbus]
MKNFLINTLLFAAASLSALAQTDSVQKVKPLKIRHAEPLYMDLIRDLGARKGEKEWNVGYGVEGHKDYTINHSFVEYEFSPMNRLGLEVEVPFALYRNAGKKEGIEVPKNRVEGLKLAAQYTFLVSGKHQMSMAGGYMHEFRAHSFYAMDHGRGMLKGNSISPFFIVAKKFGNRINTMIYTGPEWEFTPEESKRELYYQINASMHYVLPDGNFVGVEVNDEFSSMSRHTVLRPQMKLVLSSNLALGLVTGIPTNFRTDGMSFMARVIFEPKSRK